MGDKGLPAYSPPRRILFFLSALSVGGAERQSVELARQLAARGHDCRFLAFHRNYSDNIADAEVLARTTFSETGRRMLDPRSFDNVWREIDRLCPDVVVGVGPVPALLAVWGKSLGRYATRIVSVLHSSTHLSLKEQLIFPLLRRTLRAADCLVYVSTRQRDMWVERGLRARQSIVIHNGIDVDLYSPSLVLPARAEARQTLGLAPDDFVISLVAALRPVKNHGQLLEAVAALRARRLPAKALFVGEGPTRARLEAHAVRLGLTEHIVFAGERNDVRPFLVAADVGVLCSWSEAFPIAALETMAMGLPMVMSNVGGAAEIVEHKVSGFLFQCGDTAALVAALAELTGAATRDRMGGEAAARIRGTFTNRAMTDAYETLFEGLLAPREGVTISPAPGGASRGRNL